MYRVFIIEDLGKGPLGEVMDPGLDLVCYKVRMVEEVRIVELVVCTVEGVTAVDLDSFGSEPTSSYDHAITPNAILSPPPNDALISKAKCGAVNDGVSCHQEPASC